MSKFNSKQGYNSNIKVVECISDSKATPEDASQAGSKIDLLKKNGYINNDNFAYPMSPSNTNEQTMHTKVKPFEKFDED
jgi:hypothetical protein